MKVDETSVDTAKTVDILTVKQFLINSKWNSIMCDISYWEKNNNFSKFVNKDKEKSTWSYNVILTSVLCARKAHIYSTHIHILCVYNACVRSLYIYIYIYIYIYFIWHQSMTAVDCYQCCCICICCFVIVQLQTSMQAQLWPNDLLIIINPNPNQTHNHKS